MYRDETKNLVELPDVQIYDYPRDKVTYPNGQSVGTRYGINITEDCINKWYHLMASASLGVWENDFSMCNHCTFSVVLNGFGSMIINKLMSDTTKVVSGLSVYNKFGAYENENNNELLYNFGIDSILSDNNTGITTASLETYSLDLLLIFMRAE